MWGRPDEAKTCLQECLDIKQKCSKVAAGVVTRVSFALAAAAVRMNVGVAQRVRATTLYGGSVRVRVLPEMEIPPGSGPILTELLFSLLSVRPLV